MSKKLYTGNDFLDRLAEGPFVKNPDYNPKTKAGRNQPPLLIDTTPGNIEGGAMSNTVNKLKRIQFNNRSLSRDLESIKEDEELGITFSPYNSDEELNKARAETQSNFAKFGNFLMQAGVGEVVLGTLEGFGNIADGVINSFTGDNYGKNPYTEYMSQVKEDFNNNFKIYQENPDESWQLGDFGWLMQNLVSVASTASLMLPAAGWSRAIGGLGKITRFNKLANIGVRGISRGIAKASDKLAGTGKYSALRNLANKSNRIEQTIKGGSSIVSQALLSRTGENYMEAKSIYDEVYTNSKENLDNMPDEEFAKFLNNNPNFRNMSKDDIAKEIARQSGNKTFYNDYWMLAMDIMQFKALGGLWGKGVKRSSTASERIAAQNIRKTFAGAKPEELIKDNYINRVKEDIKYAFKNPLQSVTALELGEGFEEMYQGIQSEKGKEVAAKYFNPKFTERTLGSYLKDGSIWEQFAFGALGGVLFNKIGKGIQKGSRAYEGWHNKKHMSAEDYERWKMTDDKIAINDLQSVTGKAEAFIKNMEKINNNINPYNYVIDPSTGRVVIKDGNLINETIDDNQKELLKEKTIDDFVIDSALNATDNGTYDLLTEILKSDEFDGYLKKNGLDITGADKALNVQIANRMNEVYDIYTTSLNDVNSLTDSTNPYVTRNVARNITRNKLTLEEYYRQLANVDTLLNKEEGIEDYQTYLEKQIYNNAQRHLNNIQQEINNIRESYAKGEISKSTLEYKEKELRKLQDVWKNHLFSFTTEGLFDSLKEYDVDDNLIKEINNTISNFFTSNVDNAIPTETIKDLIKQKIDLNTRINYTQSAIPINQQEMIDMYNEFGEAMDEVYKNKVNDAFNTIENYFKNSDDLDKTVNDLLTGNNIDKKIKEAMDIIKYGYIPLDKPTDVTLSRIDINQRFDKLIDKIRKGKEEVKDLQEEAKDNGVTIPTDEEFNEEQNEEQTEEQDTETPSSTGDLTPSDIIGATSTKKDDESETKTNTESQGVDLGEKPVDVVDKTAAAATIGTEEQENETLLKENAAIAAGYETPMLKASLYAGKYIAIIGTKESGRLQAITDALANKDYSKYNAFINEIKEILISQGYGKNIAEAAAKEAFSNTVNAFAAINSKSVFGKLAYQLSLGFNEETSKKYSNTELIDGAGVDEVFDKFVEEYNKIINNNKLPDGRSIINVRELFDYILNNEEIDKKTAIELFNRFNNYITTNTSNKYIFTGFTKNNKITATQFFNEIKEHKSQVLDKANELHVSPIEADQRTPEFKKALLNIANGGKVIIEEQKDIHGIITNLNVFSIITKGNKQHKIKIGILRTVETSSDFNSIYPVSHHSGYKFRIDLNDNKEAKLDVDNFFEELILNKDNNPNARELFNDLLEYRLATKDAYTKYISNIIDNNELQRLLNIAMPAEKANRILNNPLVQDLIKTGKYRFYNGLKTDIDRAKAFSYTTANILFYGDESHQDNDNDYYANDFVADDAAMLKYYIEFRDKIYDNYKHTIQLQKALSSSKEVITKGNVEYFTQVNIENDPTKHKELSKIGFNVDKTSSEYTPFVMINKEGYLVDEYGNNYGPADIQFKAYSAGFIINNNNDEFDVAYITNNKNVNDDLKEGIKQEIINNITRQFNNTSESNHGDTFKNILDTMFELFGSNIFYFNNIQIIADKNKTYFSIVEKTKDNNGKDVNRNLITFYSKNVSKNGTEATNSNAISIYNDKGKAININSFTGGKNISAKEVNTLLDNIINKIISNAVINKSLGIMQAPVTDVSTNKLFTKSKEGFTIHLGGKDYKYKNYGDFIIKSNAFTSNVYKTNGSFVGKYIASSRFTIDTKVINPDGFSKEDLNKTAVSDLLYDNDTKKAKRKTVDTKTILETAGVSQEAIDILMGTNSNIPILTKQISISEKDDNSNMYYDTSTKKVYITRKGAFAINNNPTNAVRLIVHENIHRHFNNKSTISKEEKQRIIDELEEVYNYTINKLNIDVANGIITKDVYDSIINVFNQATSYSTKEKNMEEFLVECITQPVIAKYLNNTEYKEAVDITGISEKNKTIFQKIIDIILDLFGINDGRVKNNSILAKEYLMLSNVANVGKGANLFKTDSAKSPVEGESTNISQQTKSTSNINTKVLDDTKATIDNIEKDFSSRIKRADDFETSHKYLIDGKEVDYSVTQKIHGKQDLGEWGIPSSTLGNTADEAARIYFDLDLNENSTLPEEFNSLPNLTKEEDGISDRALDMNSALHLKQEIDKIRNYLDNRFGKGKYRTVTREFPIGGTIEVNGEIKTIAGTMDMLVYTDNGDIYIFDFKTKHTGNTAGKVSETTLIGYKQQLNIYRQILEENYPKLKGKIKLGGLIKFNVDYPNPGNNIKYRKQGNQLQVEENGEFVNIQDAVSVEYNSPYFANELTDPDTVIQADIVDYGDKIGALPEKVKEEVITEEKQETVEEQKEDITDIAGAEEFKQTESLFESEEDDFADDYDFDDDIFNANTELIDESNITNSSEIYSESAIKDINNNPYGIKVIDNMVTFVNSFPTQYRTEIKQLLADNEINYFCS